jgi:hypothetical protein
MSGFLHSVGKVFKKVVKAAIKIAPYAIMVGAVVLTGGAALGALPAVGSVIGGLGLSAGVTAALTTAVTTAAIGTAVGAGTAALSGGNILKGASQGALAGAVSGGILGAVAPAATAAGSAASTAGEFAAPALTGDAASTAAAWGGGTGIAALDSVPALATAAPAAITGLPGIAAPAASGGGVSGLLGSALKSPVVAGLIQGVGNGISANETAKAQQRMAQDNRDFLTGNYKTSGAGLLGQQVQPVTAGYVAPADKFDPLVYGGQFLINKETGKLQYVPRAQQPQPQGA